MAKKTGTGDNSGFDFVGWDDRIRRDLYSRMSQYDNDWYKNRALVENKSSVNGQVFGKLKASLVRELSNVVHSRIAAQDPKVKAVSDDNEYADSAFTFTVVANALIRNIRFGEQLKSAIRNSLYGIGWLYEGVPGSQWSVDPKYMDFSFRNVVKVAEMESMFEEVPSHEAVVNGYDVGELEPLSPDDPVVSSSGEVPDKIFKIPSDGLPYCEWVDGTQVILPTGCSDIESADYICRIRALSFEELKAVSFIGDDAVNCNDNTYIRFFPEVDLLFIDRVYVVAELWVKRDRHDLRFNNWYACWILNNPRYTLRSMRNPIGGLVPFTPIRLKKLGEVYDSSIVRDIIDIAELYSKLIQSIETDIDRTLNPKVIHDASSLLSPKDAANLANPHYRGGVKVGNASGYKVDFGPGVSQDKLTAASFIRRLAQNQTSVSDLDTGTPIKKISATQSMQLGQSTDAMLSSIKFLVSDAASQAVLKLMYLYNITAPTNKKFKYGNDVVEFSRQSSDFTASVNFEVTVDDIDGDPKESDRMLAIQFIRVLAQNQPLAQQYDQSVIAKWLAKMFGVDSSAVIEKRPSMPDIRQLDENGLPISNVVPMDGHVVPMDGQSGVRMPGDRLDSQQGLNVGAINQMTGMMR